MNKLVKYLFLISLLTFEVNSYAQMKLSANLSLGRGINPKIQMNNYNVENAGATSLFAGLEGQFSLSPKLLLRMEFW